MVHSRVLRATNVVLLLTGYQMYWFEKKSQRFRVSLPGVVHTFLLGCIYAACFSQHFDPTSSLLKVLKDVSPFLYGLTRMQLLLGVKAIAFAIYSSVRAMEKVNSLVESLSIRNRRGLWKDEAVAYALLGSTFGILFCFVLYISYEMKFELPPRQDVMVGTALFLPHLILSGSARLYNILAWLTRSELQQLKKNVLDELNANLIKNQATEASTSFTISTVNTSLDTMECQKRQLEAIGNRFRCLFNSLQSSMMLLFALNGNCLLGGIYSYVYYRHTWHVLFEDRKQRIFYAANASIYACIASDYICLMVVQALMERQCSRFVKVVDSFLVQRNVLPKRMRSLGKDIKQVIQTAFNSKYNSLWRFNFCYLSSIIFIQLLIVAVLVAFHYLNDEILLLKEELSAKSDE
ncbi:hypothetical protein KR032_004736 [Drosophila birchii]|nr:hypothetical protein KR032_004736 [Drosophila birchii]